MIVRYDNISLVLAKEMKLTSKSSAENQKIDFQATSEKASKTITQEAKVGPPCDMGHTSRCVTGRGGMAVLKLLLVT